MDSSYASDNPITNPFHAYRRTKCKGKLYVSDLGAVKAGAHMSNCVPQFRRAPVGPAPTITDRMEEMMVATNYVCVRGVTLTPTEVWRMVRDQFYGGDNEILRSATQKQFSGRLYRSRAKRFGRESFGRLKQKPLCNVEESGGFKYFQFHVTYYEDEVRHRLIGWLHPHLMDRMTQRQSSIFVNATYRCVPAPFYQLVIVMLDDTISDLYLPVCNICVSSKQKLAPALVCDFAFAVLKAVQYQFPEARIVKCPFHFEQALRRKILQLRITGNEVMMRKGCIDRLTIIRRMNISPPSVDEVRSMIKRDYYEKEISYSRDNWKQFWKHFKKIWINKSKPEWWNISSVRKDIFNRTNNPLERYNRTLNSTFPGSHPDLIRFISVIEKQSRETARLLSDI
ncbi:hypothetical protein GN958_ATG13404 [Phytophthora infestans]|uniref:MULE transposase domain-containing protein n=1 Tax=Phytophthora infestans TaxID=4787 RepID=A0A8S9U8K2_PHYIN|nr:hypothetical protein GN958_ATG13404 [Phytophthora infestans]